MDLYQPSVLVIGYGNPGRLDDGLGPAFASAIEEWDLPNLTVEIGYQLSIEDAHLASLYDFVIFADASVNTNGPFHFRELEPFFTLEYTSHHLQPSGVLGIAHSLFDSKVRGFELGIRGYEFEDFGEGLSEKARKNLDAALGSMELFIKYERARLPELSENLKSIPKKS